MEFIVLLAVFALGFISAYLFELSVSKVENTLRDRREARKVELRDELVREGWDVTYNPTRGWDYIQS